MSHSVLIACGLAPRDCMPALKFSYWASSSDFFFLPIARRSRSAWPSV